VSLASFAIEQTKSRPRVVTLVEDSAEHNLFSGLVPGDEANGKYTVPAIYHVPTNKYIMDSAPISRFLEETYPEPSVPLESELGQEITARSRAVIGATMFKSLMPREVNILSPRAAEYFRQTREPMLGRPPEDFLDPAAEEQAWAAVAGALDDVDKLIRTNSAEGPFVLGARPSYTDFFIAGALQSAKMVDERTFERVAKYPGYSGIYLACVPYMARHD
jgi:glutathione S-transferase